MSSTWRFGALPHATRIAGLWLAGTCKENMASTIGLKCPFEDDPAVFTVWCSILTHENQTILKDMLQKPNLEWCYSIEFCSFLSSHSGSQCKLLSWGAPTQVDNWVNRSRNQKGNLITAHSEIYLVFHFLKASQKSFFPQIWFFSIKEVGPLSLPGGEISLRLLSTLISGKSVRNPSLREIGIDPKFCTCVEGSLRLIFIQLGLMFCMKRSLVTRYIFHNSWPYRTRTFYWPGCAGIEGICKHPINPINPGSTGLKCWATRGATQMFHNCVWLLTAGPKNYWSQLVGIAQFSCKPSWPYSIWPTKHRRQPFDARTIVFVSNFLLPFQKSWTVTWKWRWVWYGPSSYDSPSRTSQWKVRRTNNKVLHATCVVFVP